MLPPTYETKIKLKNIKNSSLAFLCIYKINYI